VTDDGDGVPEEVGDVFEPGVRDARSEGAGLGLALARRLARSVGGDAVLVSRAPAVFGILVPAASDVS
jgi:two-component system, OmpR family, sensor kinase